MSDASYGAITRDAFTAVMLRRGVCDVDYESYLRRHPEERSGGLLARP